jgi:protein-disulfide isomerase
MKKVKNIALMLMGVSSISLAVAEVSEAEQKKIEEAIVKMLETNPEKFAAAMQRGVEKQQEVQAKKAESSIKANLDQVKKLALRIGTDENAGVIAFVDPVCPYCRKWSEEALKAKGVTLHIVPAPILRNEQSDTIGKMMVLTYKQDPAKFKEFMEKYHADPSKMDKESLLKLLKKIGVDVKKIEEGLSEKDLYKDYQELATKAEIQQVPTLYIFKGDRVDIMPPMEADVLEKAYKDYMDGKLHPAEDKTEKAS